MVAVLPYILQLPSEEAWLIGEHRTPGKKKYYLANLPATTDPHISSYNHGAMDLRTDPSAVERGTRA
jgi:hypothetical protein